MKIVVTGASGFVGSHIIEGLLRQGHSVRGLSRVLPAGPRRHAGAEYVDGVNIAEAGTLTAAMFRDVDAVIHLVGIIQEGRGGQTFQRVHVEGTRSVVEAARSSDFKGRFIYMSAIGSDPDAPAEYSRTKARAEEIVRTSGFSYTIFRPSIILGIDGEFAAQMQDLIKYGGLPVKLPFPVIPVPGNGKNLFQPVDIDDLTRCVVECLDDPACADKVFEIGGAEQVSFNVLLQGFAGALGVRKPLLHAPIPILRVVATIMEAILPKPPVTRDQLANLGRDNVTTSHAIVDVFGVKPHGFHDILARMYSLPPDPTVGETARGTRPQAG